MRLFRHIPPGGGHWQGDYVSQMNWKHRRVSIDELDSVEVEKELWASLLRPMPHDLVLDKQ